MCRFVFVLCHRTAWFRAGGRSKYQPRQEEGCQGGGGSGGLMCPLDPARKRGSFLSICVMKLGFFLIVRSTYSELHVYLFIYLRLQDKP